MYACIDLPTYVPSLCTLQTANIQNRETEGQDKEEEKGTGNNGRKRRKDRIEEEEQGKRTRWLRMGHGNRKGNDERKHLF